MTSPAWLIVQCSVLPDQVESMEHALEQAGALAVTLNNPNESEHPAVFQEQPLATPLWPSTQVNGLFPGELEYRLVFASIKQYLPASLQSLPLDYYTLIDKNWVAEGQKYFKPMCFGDTLWVCPSWLTPPEPEATNLLLDPGLAFGTGTHATTDLCLQWIAHTAKTQPFTGLNVVDYGCGSGILAIACVLLGVKTVYAIDHDPQALQASQANAALNGILAENLKLLAPNELDSQFKADIILANILAEPLISLAPTLARMSRPNTVIVLSGLLIEQIDSVWAAYEPWCSLNSQECADKDGWARLVLTVNNIP